MSVQPDLLFRRCGDELALLQVTDSMLFQDVHRIALILDGRGLVCSHQPPASRKLVGIVSRTTGGCMEECHLQRGYFRQNVSAAQRAGMSVVPVR